MRKNTHIAILVAALSAISAARSQTSPSQPASTPVITFDAARAALLRGDYRAASEIYDELAKQPSDSLRAACGIAEVSLEKGEYASGVECLKKSAGQGERDSIWHCLMAALLAEQGEYESARRHNQAAIKLDAGNYRARWQLSEIQTTLGGTDAAIETCRFFNDQMTGDQLPDRAEDLVYLGKGFLKFSTLTQHPELSARKRHVLSEVYQEAFQFVDPAYWPARLAAAELLATSHNDQEARSDFEGVIEKNPHATGAIVGLGHLDLAEWKFEEVEKHALHALKINPSCVPAHLLLAEMKMIEQRPDLAVAPLTKSLEINPNSIEALSLLAAAYTRTADKQSAAACVGRIEKLVPRPALLHFTLGVWQYAARQYITAEDHFKKAIEYAPYWAEPRTCLGQVYMDAGDETRARKELESSFALDSFDARTHSVLDLLDTLDRYEELESPHFILKYDARSEGIVAPYFSERLEQLYPEVCKRFGTEPTSKTMIEIFPDHMGFSLRVSGRPFIATIGACSGRVIALHAPRPGNPMGEDCWVEVLRHEFAHTVTLFATENRIPHWMTEGMAVLVETQPRPWNVKQLLCINYRQDRLFTLESLYWGFVRPKRSNDRMLAYMQSEWMLEYAIEKFGEHIIVDFLKAFRDGQTQDQAIRNVLDSTPADFEVGFRKWAGTQFTSWGLPISPIRDAKVIKAALEKSPDDAALWGELAESHAADDDWKDARRAARKALKRNKNERRALEILSQISLGEMLAEKDEGRREELVDEVDELARRLHRIDGNNPVAMKCLGLTEQSWEQWREAISWHKKYQERVPEDPESYNYLSRIYIQQEKLDLALPQLEGLFERRPNDAKVARQVAELHWENRRAKPAAEWYTRALEIDPYDVSTHAALANAWLRAGNLDAAEREYTVLSKLCPEKPDGHDGLAEVRRIRALQGQ